MSGCRGKLCVDDVDSFLYFDYVLFLGKQKFLPYWYRPPVVFFDFLKFEQVILTHQLRSASGVEACLLLPQGTLNPHQK